MKNGKLKYIKHFTNSTLLYTAIVIRMRLTMFSNPKQSRDIRTDSHISVPSFTYKLLYTISSFTTAIFFTYVSFKILTFFHTVIAYYLASNYRVFVWSFLLFACFWTCRNNNNTRGGELKKRFSSSPSNYTKYYFKIYFYANI